MITLHLDPETEALLREMAQEAGKRVEDFLSQQFQEWLDDKSDEELLRIAEERDALDEQPLSNEEVGRALGLVD